ncbi:MAG: hypothetical protein QXQ20_08430 [Candidatus Nezhaarchaeales archaeon]
MIEEKDILDLAARIAVQARIDGVERSQMENLLASVETSSDPKMSPYFVTLYAYSRVGRKEMGEKTAALIHEAMNKLYEAGCEREEVRKLLGLAKWVYESFEEKELKEEKEGKEELTKVLREIINDVLKRRKTDTRNLTFRDTLEIIRAFREKASKLKSKG